MPAKERFAVMSKRKGDTETLQAMLGIYCQDKHEGAETLCPDCRELLDYAEARLAKCPFGENKPTCARCTVHCYKPAMRARIREVMTFSGPRMLRRHPVLALKHLVHGILGNPRKHRSTSPD